MIPTNQLTHILGRISETDFVDNDERVQTRSDPSAERSRRDVSDTAGIVVCTLLTCFGGNRI